MLKDLKTSKKKFENHINVFTILISKVLEAYEDLDYLKETYISDLKFDGIFI